MQSFRSLIRRLTWLVCFSLALPLIGGAQTSTPADTNAAATKPTPSGQAPDEVMKKLADLVHAGKYAEAQRLAAGLLQAYPDDQRLIKAKALLDKSLASSKAGDPAASSDPPESIVVSARPTVSTNAVQLTGMDKVDYDALIELARQAQQNTDLDQQKTFLKQFMNQSSPFLQKYPNEMLLWQLRAATAISLDDSIAGYEAGQKLLATGVTDSTDANLRRLLAQLKNKGWLEKEAGQHRYILMNFIDDGAATDQSPNAYEVTFMLAMLRTNLDHDLAALLLPRFPRSDILTIPDPHADPVLKVTITIHSAGWHWHIGWSPSCSVDSQFAISVSFPKGLSVDRTFKLAIIKRKPDQAEHDYDDTTLISGWIGQELIGHLRDLLDEDVVRTSLATPAP